MTKGAIQAASQAKKEQIIHVGQNCMKVTKADRNRMQRKEEEEMEKQLKLNAEAAVKNVNYYMDVDLAFHTNTTHSWGIHGNDIKKTQTKEEPGKVSPKRKKRRRLTPFSLQ